MSGPAILIISPEHWVDNFVSKHHYSLALSKAGCKVFFLDPPDNSTADIMVEAVESAPSLWKVSSKPVVRGLRFFPCFLRRFLERRWLKQLEEVAGCTISVVWLFENSRFFDMSFAGGRLKIYHQVDLNQDFHPEIAGSTADICFCVTDSISAKLKPHSPRVYKIHHGLAQMDIGESLSSEQLSYFKVKNIDAVYIGNLDIRYLDQSLVELLIKNFADVQFHFVGNFSQDNFLVNLASQFSNIRLWGRVSSDQIPQILERADVLLVTYDVQGNVEQLASPHKMMEYLGSGKVIVSTYTDEYKDKRHLLEMVDDSEDFIGVFKNIIENLDKFNSAEKIKMRKSFALDNTYPLQLQRINEKLIQNDLPAIICNE